MAPSATSAAAVVAAVVSSFGGWQLYQQRFADELTSATEAIKAPVVEATLQETLQAVYSQLSEIVSEGDYNKILELPYVAKIIAAGLCFDVVMALVAVVMASAVFARCCCFCCSRSKPKENTVQSSTVPKAVTKDVDLNVAEQATNDKISEVDVKLPEEGTSNEEKINDEEAKQPEEEKQPSEASSQ
jgi:hypothetical protein